MILDTSAMLILALSAMCTAPAFAAAAQRAQHAQPLKDAAIAGGSSPLTGGARRSLQFSRLSAGSFPPSRFSVRPLAEDRKPGRGTGDDSGSGSNSSGGEDSGSEGEVTCTSHTTEVEVKAEGNAEIHSSAISKAFAMACKAGSDVNMKMFEDIFMEEDAYAFAHATAIAMISCTSTDEDAYHCASVTASATAFAEATAEAHASAVSTAVASCGCMTSAVSVGVASSDIYVNLVAEATATATANVCIKGEGKVSASAYDSCSSKVFGKVFARAMSEAIVKSDCLNSKAISRVLTEAGAKFDSYSTCGLTAEAIITY